jgi:hypothetical protein
MRGALRLASHPRVAQGPGVLAEQKQVGETLVDDAVAGNIRLPRQSARSSRTRFAPRNAFSMDFCSPSPFARSFGTSHFFETPVGSLPAGFSPTAREKNQQAQSRQFPSLH